MSDVSKPRILFVDKDSNYLNDLRKMLESMKNVWEMFFIAKGSEATLLLQAENPCDVVIANLEMSDLDGIEFFQNLKAAHPEIIRMTFTESGGDGSTTRAANLAQQSIAKPSSTHELSILIYRALNLRTRLAESPLRRRLHEVGGLPSLPTLYKEMTDEMNSDDPSIAKISEIIAKDVSMSAKVLQVVNSAGIGLRHEVSDVKHAASMLGMEKISVLVLMAEVFSLVSQNQLPPGFSLDALWSHSMTVGEFAKKIMQNEVDDSAFVDQAFTAGLLHDIGVIILVSQFPEDFKKALALAKSEGISLFESEKRVFNSTHAEVGGYMIDLWGLADPIAEAITYHDLPSSFPESAYPSNVPEHQLTPLIAVHIANSFCENERADAYGCPEGEIDNLFIERLGLLEKLEEWWELCH